MPLRLAHHAVAVWSRATGPQRLLAVGVWSAGVAYTGYVVGRGDERSRNRALPQLRTCCKPNQELSADQAQLTGKLQSIVGDGNVFTDADATTYTKGTRIGSGEALAVVKPGSLRETVDVLRACVHAGVAILPQGKNTGLTGGSVPRDQCDRPTVVLSTRRLTAIKIFPEGEQVLCLAGAGIFDLGTQLGKEVGREGHSVLGSIFLNPSVAAGVAFGSGGTQLRKGPVYTERALYCRVSEGGDIELVNSLGIAASTEEELFAKLEGEAALSAADLEPTELPASDRTYSQKVCQLDGTVSRYNADTHGPDCNRSEGKVVILASVHDTFAKPSEEEMLWISCKDLATAQALKAEALLSVAADLPKQVEYLDRDTFDVVNGSGRALCFVLAQVGIGPMLSSLW